MFRFIKQIFVSAKMFFGCNVSGVHSLNAVPKCISMNNQECKIRFEIVNTYNIKVNTCSGSCNDISVPYSKLCVSDVVKNINAFLMSLKT